MPVRRRQQRLRHDRQLEVQAEIDQQQAVVAACAEEAQAERLGPQHRPVTRADRARAATRPGPRGAGGAGRGAGAAGAPLASCSAQSSLQRRKVAGSSGRGIAACMAGVARLGNWAHLRLAASVDRIRDLARIVGEVEERLPRPPNSWPWNSIGVPGPSSSSAVSAR